MQYIHSIYCIICSYIVYWYQCSKWTKRNTCTGMDLSLSPFLCLPFPISLLSPNQLGGLGSAISSPNRAWGRVPATNACMWYFELRKRTWWQQYYLPLRPSSESRGGMVSSRPKKYWYAILAHIVPLWALTGPSICDWVLFDVNCFILLIRLVVLWCRFAPWLLVAVLEDISESSRVCKVQ